MRHRAEDPVATVDSVHRERRRRRVPPVDLPSHLEKRVGVGKPGPSPGSEVCGQDPEGSEGEEGDAQPLPGLAPGEAGPSGEEAEEASRRKAGEEGERESSSSVPHGGRRGHEETNEGDAEQELAERDVKRLRVAPQVRRRGRRQEAEDAGRPNRKGWSVPAHRRGYDEQLAARDEDDESQGPPAAVTRDQGMRGSSQRRNSQEGRSLPLLP